MDTEAFGPAESTEDYYLMVGELVPYKRADLAVRAFSRAGKKLVVVGAGEQLSELRRLAGPSVEVTGRLPSSRDPREVCPLSRSSCSPVKRTLALFPIEAMASGRPVIAFRRGGVLETVVEGRTGLFLR